MYKKDFISLLNSPNIPNFFLLYGAESYQVEFYTNELLSKYNKELIEQGYRIETT